MEGIFGVCKSPVEPLDVEIEAVVETAGRLWSVTDEELPRVVCGEDEKGILFGRGGRVPSCR
jgi:hypothetical protein